MIHRLDAIQKDKYEFLYQSIKRILCLIRLQLFCWNFSSSYDTFTPIHGGPTSPLWWFTGLCCRLARNALRGHKFSNPGEDAQALEWADWHHLWGQGWGFAFSNQDEKILHLWVPWLDLFISIWDRVWWSADCSQRHLQTVPHKSGRFLHQWYPIFCILDYY